MFHISRYTTKKVRLKPPPTFFLGEILVQHHVLHQQRQVIVQVRLLVVPHVREPHELVDILQNQVVALVLLAIAVVEVLPREAEVEPEPGHHAGQARLRVDQRLHILGPKARAHLAHENVVDVDQEFPFQGEAELPVTEVAQAVEEQQPVEPETQARAEDHPLNVVKYAVVLDDGGEGSPRATWVYVKFIQIETLLSNRTRFHLQDKKNS